ncbi:CinA family protein [Stella sp.]|uniref:CinA family protein n=1 Tax=Stella sp. TaxID=2912054 RepID=UPI0035B2C7A4
MTDEWTEPLADLAIRALGECRARGLMVATAESCTGGLVAAALTEIAGSSDVVERGFVTYSNAAKAEMLGVPMPLIQDFGAVSAEVARAMAEGAIRNSAAAVAVAVTGIAGPGGATPTKPVGLVHFAAAGRGQATVDERHVLPGDRAAIRRRAVAIALRMIREAAAR